jgi:hypothetical protein
MYREKGYATIRSLLRNVAGGCLNESAGAMDRVEMTGGRGLEFAQAAHKRNVTLVSRIVFMANSEAVAQELL